MHSTIRKRGNATSIIIPAVALAKSGFNLGETVEVEVVEGQIVIKQPAPVYNLNELLKASHQEAIEPDDSDREWLHDSPVGKELD